MARSRLLSLGSIAQARGAQKGRVRQALAEVFPAVSVSEFAGRQETPRNGHAGADAARRRRSPWICERSGPTRRMTSHPWLANPAGNQREDRGQGRRRSSMT